MPRSGVLARRVALTVIAVGSVAWACYLVWRMAARENIAGVPSIHLLGTLALVPLPAATWVAWRLDRRHRLRPNRPELPENRRG